MHSKILLVGLVLVSFISISQATWLQQHSGSRILYDIDFPPYDVTNGFACGANSTLLKTTDGGDEWVRVLSVIASGSYNALSFPGDPMVGYIACDSSNVLITTTGGDMWSVVNVRGPGNLNAIHFLNNDKGFVAGNKGYVGRTVDAGAAWANISLSDSTNLYGVFFFSPEKGFVVGDSGSIFYTTDGGTNWTDIPSNVTTRLNDVYFLGESNGWIAGAGRTLLQTQDGGINWTPLTVSLPTNIDLFSVIFPVDAQTGFACGSEGRIAKTTDGGSSWETSTNLTSNLFSIEFPMDAMTGWVCGAGEVIYQTTNGGWIEEDKAKPVNGTRTLNCQPNPFLNHTAIKFSTPEFSKGNLTIYDCAGNFVRTIVMNSNGVANWDGKNEMNQRVTPGVYLLEYVTANGVTEHLKLTVLE